MTPNAKPEQNKYKNSPKWCPKYTSKLENVKMFTNFELAGLLNQKGEAPGQRGAILDKRGGCTLTL